MYLDIPTTKCAYSLTNPLFLKRVFSCFIISLVSLFYS